MLPSSIEMQICQGKRNGRESNSSAKKKFDYSLTCRWIDSTDVVQQRQGEGADNKKIEIQKTFGVSLTCVGSRWQWNKRGAIGESTLVGRFFLLHFKGLHTTGGDGKEQKLHNPITFFFIVFFLYRRVFFHLLDVFFFLRERVEQKKTDDTGWRSWWDVLSRMFFFLLLLLSLS